MLIPRCRKRYWKKKKHFILSCPCNLYAEHAHKEKLNPKHYLKWNWTGSRTNIQPMGYAGIHPIMNLKLFLSSHYWYNWSSTFTGPVTYPKPIPFLELIPNPYRSNKLLTHTVLKNCFLKHGCLEIAPILSRYKTCTSILLGHRTDREPVPVQYRFDTDALTDSINNYDFVCREGKRRMQILFNVAF